MCQMEITQKKTFECPNESANMTEYAKGHIVQNFGGRKHLLGKANWYRHTIEEDLLDPPWIPPEYHVTH